MCGIIGYMGKEEAIPYLLDGLKQLEYRGYDSAGLCVIENGDLALVKKTGKVAELADQLILKEMHSTLGIAHTRWATHGEPNETNAHPHCDCKKNIAIVHNGIIENYQSLKEILEKEGHAIVSETDSEIIAHLIEKFYENNLEEAVLQALKEIKGTFALAAIHKDEQKIVGARRGSPLILGIGEKELIITSDVSAVPKSTKKGVYLEENKIAIISPEGWIIKDFEGEFVFPEIDDLQRDVEKEDKGAFKHFMLKEIFEQPESVRKTLEGRIKGEKIDLSLNISPKKIKRIIIVACGTSWHSGLIGKYLIEKIANIPVEVDYASEFRYRSPILGEGDLVIAISQSGETADTLAALREAKRRDIPTLGIVNGIGSTMAREVDSVLYLNAGAEIGVASTKAFTCQITALLLFCLYLKQELGQADIKLLEELKKIPQKIQEILYQADKISDIAENFKDNKNFIFLGRGLEFPVAIEGALKLKEVSYIHAEGYPAAEMKHGPIALIDEHMPVVFLAPKNETYEKILSNMEEIRARKGVIIALVNEEDEKIKKLSKNIIILPKVREELSPLTSIIPLQLLSYYIANLKGIDVDKPRNLAKSVTVE